MRKNALRAKLGGNPELDFVGYSTTTGTSLSLTSLSGTGLGGDAKANDLVFVFVMSSLTTDQNYSMSTSGYTEIYDLHADYTFDAQLAVFYKRLTSADTTAVWTASDTSNSRSMAYVIRGSNPTDPIGATASRVTYTLEAPIQTPSGITLEGDDSMVVTTIAVSTSASIDGTPEYPSGYLFGYKNEDTDKGLYTCSKEITGGGTENPGAFAVLSSLDVADGIIYTTIEVKRA